MVVVAYVFAENIHALKGYINCLLDQKTKNLVPGLGLNHQNELFIRFNIPQVLLPYRNIHLYNQ